MRNSSAKALLVGAAHVAGGNAVGLLLFAGIMAVSAKDLSVPEFGFLSAAYALAQLSNDLSDFGTGMRYIIRADSMDDDPRQAELRTLLTLRILIQAALGLLWFVYGLNTGRVAACLAAGILGLLLSLRSTLQADARARRFYRASAVMLAVERSIALLVIVTFRPQTAGGVLLLLGIGSACVVIPSMWKLRYRFSMQNAVRLYAAARRFGFASLVSDLNGLEIPLVAALAGGTASGLFAIPSRLLMPLGLLGSAVSSVLLREISGQPAREGTAFVRRASVLVAVGVGALVLPLAFFAHGILTVGLGDSYGAAAAAVQFGCLAAVATAAVQPLMAGLQALHLDDLVARLVIAQMSVYLGLVSLGAILDGATGASAGAAAGSIIGLTFTWLRCKRRLDGVTGDGFARHPVS